MTREDLHYTEHDCNNGQIFIISPIEDCDCNEGGLYCEIYENNFTNDPVDNFVIHNGEDATCVAIDYMDKYYPRVKQFNELKSKDLWKLREEIILNSLFISDYENSYGFDAKDISYFFDGYSEYINELMEEDGTDENNFWDYDNEYNLFSWFNCNEDLSWIKQTIRY